MKRINREAIQRMVDARGGKAGGTNGGGGGSLAGYATQAWVNEGFVSIEFFNRLFTVYGPGETSSDPDVVIAPNDLDSTIKNIKAMFGLWTEQYLSALGLNPGGTGSATSLSMLDDVYITTPTNGQALVYNSTSLKWENQTISTVTALENLTDVLLSSPATNQVLVYDGAKWINTSLKTINYQSIIGSGDIQVGGGSSGNYLPLTGGTVRSSTSGASVEIGNVYNGNIATLRTSYGAGYGTFIGVSKTSETYILNLCNGITSTAGAGAVSQFIVLANGYVGLGTESPTCKLHIIGDTRHEGQVILEDSCYFRGAPSYGFRFNDHNSNYNNFIIYENGNTYTRGMCGVGTKTPNYKLEVVGGAIKGQYVLFTATDDSNAGYVGRGGSYSNQIQLYGYTGNSLALGANNQDVILINTSLNVGVGTNSPSYKLHVAGTIYATGGITALSDIKQKNINEYMQLGIDEVANAPIIKFTWKDPKAEDKGLHVGSIAQYWEKVLPEAVKKDKVGTLSMSYGVVALVAAISTAKKVQEHERRIADLERENKELKVRLRRLNRYGKQ